MVYKSTIRHINGSKYTYVFKIRQSRLNFSFWQNCSICDHGTSVYNQSGNLQTLFRIIMVSFIKKNRAFIG